MIFYILLTITICYLILVISFIIGFNKVKEETDFNSPPRNTFSIIVPFRNEAHNLEAILQTLIALNYPNDLFEVIFVDDDSSDSSKSLITNSLKDSMLDYSIIKNIRTSNSPKKDAVTLAITLSKHDWIATTDADCYVPEFWLSNFNSLIEQKNPKMIVAPVTFTSNGSFFQEYQYLDFLSLQGVTIGGFGMNKPFLCNGANLVYNKSSFVEINGFKNNHSIASGDDVFLLESFKTNFSNSIQYLKSYDAIVATKPEQSLKSLIQQRVRWAAKTTSYKSWFAKLVGLLVFLMNGTIILAITLSSTDLISLNQALVIIMSKFCVDFILLYKTAAFFKRAFCLKYYLVNAFLYSFFTVYVTFHAMLFNYKWKGRLYSK